MCSAAHWHKQYQQTATAVAVAVAAVTCSGGDGVGIIASSIIVIGHTDRVLGRGDRAARDLSRRVALPASLAKRAREQQQRERALQLGAAPGISA